MGFVQQHPPSFAFSALLPGKQKPQFSSQQHKTEFFLSLCQPSPRCADAAGAVGVWELLTAQGVHWGTDARQGPS